jgi:hypothetical protein
MARLLIASLFLGSFLVACADDSSGVDASKKLADLSASEIGDLCDYTSEVEGGYGASKVCGDGITITVKSREACVAMLDATVASCPATVENAEACAEAIGEDLCKLLTEPKCAFALQCSDG